MGSSIKLMDTETVNKYLYYGYLPPTIFPSWIDSCFNIVLEGYEYNANAASHLFDIIMDESLSNISTNGYCIVPISGGWDSRILLGAALDRFEPKQIKTFSFGVPGQLDFDIGRLVAEASGVEHWAIDLSCIHISWNKLITSVAEAPWTYVPDSFYNRFSIKQVANHGDVILSGFMGDPLVGGHLTKVSSKDAAVDEFLVKQRRAKSILLAKHESNVKKSIPLLPNGSYIPASELLDYGIRQANCVAPIVTPLKCWDRWGSYAGQFPQLKTDVIIPYAHPKWASYWLNAPKETKRGQKLYLDMMAHKFPRLVCLPSKYSFGAKSLSGMEYQIRKLFIRAENKLYNKIPILKCSTSPMHNYIDFDAAFREREDYREMLVKALRYLSEKEIAPWVDFDLLWQRHMSCRANHADAFLVLIGLALNLSIEHPEV